MPCHAVPVYYTAMTIKWVNRRTPNTAMAEFIARAPYEVAQGFVQVVKETAGGSLRQNQGRRWPVDTGYSRRRFRVAGRLNRGAERPPSRIFISGANYAPYVDRRGGGVLNRIWRRYARTNEFRRAHERTARAVDRP